MHGPRLRHTHVINYCTPLLVATRARQASGALLLQLLKLQEDVDPVLQIRSLVRGRIFLHRGPAVLVSGGLDKLLEFQVL
jgi:hypothetical protein